VGLDVRFLTLLLSSRIAHLPTHTGPQQQQRQQSIEMEEVSFMRDPNLKPLRHWNAGPEAVSLHHGSAKVRRRTTTVKALRGASDLEVAWRDVAFIELLAV
jgi:hypothetical protein